MVHPVVGTGSSSEWHQVVACSTRVGIPTRRREDVAVTAIEPRDHHLFVDPANFQPSQNAHHIVTHISHLGGVSQQAAQWATRIATSISDRMAAGRRFLPRRWSASAREKSRSKPPSEANHCHPSLRASSPRRMSRPAMDVVATMPRHRLLP